MGLLALRAAGARLPQRWPAASAVRQRQRAALFECVSTLNVERGGFREEYCKEKSTTWERPSVARDGGLFWSRSWGAFEQRVSCDPAACAYAFVESARVCRQVFWQSVARRTPRKRPRYFGAGEPAAAEFAGQKIGGWVGREGEGHEDLRAEAPGLNRGGRS